MSVQVLLIGAGARARARSWREGAEYKVYRRGPDHVIRVCDPNGERRSGLNRVETPLHYNSPPLSPSPSPLNRGL